MASKPHLTLNKINTIMKSSSDAEEISRESSQMMAKATELFIRTLATAGYKLANNGRKLAYKHLAEVVNAEQRYEFVRDIMPKKITVAQYKKMMRAKEKAKKGGSSDDSDSDSSSSSSDDSDDSSDDSDSESSSSKASD